MDTWPQPKRPRLTAWLLYRVQRLLAPSAFYGWLGKWLETSAVRYRIFTGTEKSIKKEIFGCRMCGQCALPATGYACPMTCPKTLRNGPCGGVRPDGGCEVVPEMRCVWLKGYDRSRKLPWRGDFSSFSLAQSCALAVAANDMATSREETLIRIFILNLLCSRR